MGEKALIMQVTGDKAVVMTTDGQFVSIPVRPGMNIGLEVEVSVSPAIGASQRKNRWTSRLGVTAAVAALVLLVGTWQWPTQMVQVQAMPSAYVSLDINPSVEMSVDQNLRVISATGVNDDGQKVLEQLSLTTQPVDQAVKQLTEKAESMGFVKQNSDIIVTTSPAGSSSNEFANSLESQLIQAVSQATKSSGKDVVVGGVTVKESIRQQAQTAGVSTGKYAVYLQAKAKGVPVTVDDFKKQSVTQVANKHKDVQTIVDSMKGQLSLDELLAELKKKIDIASPVEPAKKNPKDYNEKNKGNSSNHPESDKHGESKNNTKSLPITPTIPSVPTVPTKDGKIIPSLPPKVGSVEVGSSSDEKDEDSKNKTVKNENSVIPSIVPEVPVNQENLPSLIKPDQKVRDVKKDANLDRPSTNHHRTNHFKSKSLFFSQFIVQGV